jgi:hypothetical protein
MRFCFLVPAFLMSLLPIEAALVVVDSFTFGQGNVITNFGHQNGVSYGPTSEVDSGGSRQPFVDAINPVGLFDFARIAFENGRMTFTSQNARGVVGLIYQAEDLDLSENFSSGGSVVFAFESPLGTNLNLFFQFGSTNLGKVAITKTIPAGVSTYSIPLSDFEPSGEEPFDPSQVSLIYPHLTVPSLVGATYSIDSITIIPEPGSGLLILGVGLMGAMRRSRRSSAS